MGGNTNRVSSFAFGVHNLLVGARVVAQKEISVIFMELEGLDVTKVTFGSNGIHIRFVRLAGIVRTSFWDEPHLFSAHLQEDGAMEFKEDRHAQMYTL